MTLSKSLETTMSDLKTTKEERERARPHYEDGLVLRAFDDLDTLEAECADLRAQNKAMTEVLADLRRLNEAEVERLRGVLEEVADNACDTRPYGTNCDRRCAEIARKALEKKP